MGFLAGIGAKVLGWFTSFFGSLIQYAGIYFAYRLGSKKEQQREAVNAAKVKDEQLEIAARPDKHRDDIIARMRRGKL